MTGAVAALFAMYSDEIRELSYFGTQVMTTSSRKSIRRKPRELSAVDPL